MKRTIGILGVSLLLLPVAASPASREQQEMQRDIAQLQDQVRTLQSGFDQKMSALQTLVEQALEAGNRANTSVSVLNSSVTQTLDRELKGALLPIAGLTAKVNNVGNDVSDLRNSIADLNTQMNRQQQLLTDINNALKVIQAPAPPPPGADAASGGAPAGGALPGGPSARGGAPPSARALYEGANADYSSGKADLAAEEFANFIRYYPDDPNAPAAQFFIGQIHESQQKHDLAAMDFDAVLERYPENKYTTDSYLMKGMALKFGGHRDMAATEFRNLIRKYPRSDQAQKASEQLRAMGLSPGAASTAAARRKKG